MKPVLTIEDLIKSAKVFCETESRINHIKLIGVTDGKAVGTYVEHRFQDYVQTKFLFIRQIKDILLSVMRFNRDCSTQELLH